MNVLPKCINELRSILNAEPRIILDLPSGYRRAAVLIPIIVQNDEWRLVFTRRTSQVSHHKGEVAFPGGRFDTKVDENLCQTALRETEEELGIKEVQIIGQIDDIVTISKYIVTPIVGFIKDNSEINHKSINTQEIDYILEVPVSKLAHPEIFSQKNLSYKNDRILSVPFFDYNGEIIWGATGRIIINFLSKVNMLSLDCRLNIMKRESWKFK